MINYKKSIFAIIMALAVIASAAGAVIAADLNWTADTAVTINSNNYTIRSGSAATSMEVGATTLTVTVPSGSSFALISTSGHTLSNDQSLILTCSSGQSTLTITGPKTVIITPSVAQACNTAGQGGTTVVSTPTPTPAPTLTPAPTATPTPTPTTGPATPAAPSGVTLYRAQGDPRVYVIKDGKKQWIKTPEEFNAAGYKWSDISEVTPGTIAAYPDVSIILIRATGDTKVYVVENGQKQWIKTAEEFNAAGYKWSDISEVAASALTAYLDVGTMIVKIINTPTLRVRQSNTTQSSILSNVKRNETYAVIEEKNGWYKIKTAAGIVGWISGLYAEKK
jgi:hypothetical protein